MLTTNDSCFCGTKFSDSFYYSQCTTNTCCKWLLWPLLTAVLETARSVIVRHQQLLSNLNSCDKRDGDLQKEAMSTKYAELFEISNKYCSEFYLMELVVK